MSNFASGPPQLTLIFMETKLPYVRPLADTAFVVMGKILEDSYVTGTIGDGSWDDYVTEG